MKTKIVYRCQECGYVSIKWLGKCPDCSGWNTFLEEKEAPEIGQGARRILQFSSEILTLDGISMETEGRCPIGINEFDRMLGGGIVPGSIILIGGPPGIGKSTLLLQAAAKIVSSRNTLYISGEESLQQIKLRALRLGIDSVKIKNLYFLSETNLENILEAVNKINPQFLIIDSIQTMYRSDFPSAPGTVTQVRECAAELVNLAKTRGLSVFLLGHVTKEGAIAGPRILEHLVDTVLYFEPEKQYTYRILRAYKNRFGPTNEIGIFEMKTDGLYEVPNPSNIFLEERAMLTPGTVVTAVLEGTRPLLLEVQALVSKANFSLPRRMVQGLDYNRVMMLIAILEKRFNYPLGNQDIFVNIVGGIKVKETAVDLSVALSIASALLNFVFPADTVIMGEVGLTGEVRSIGQIDLRIREAEKLGFKRCFIPEYNSRNLKEKFKLETIGISRVEEAIKYLSK